MPTIDELRKKALEIVTRVTGQVRAGDGVSPQTKDALVRSGVFDPKVDFAPAEPGAPVEPGYLPDPTEAELDRKRALQAETLRRQRAEDAERRRRALSGRVGASFGTPTGPQVLPSRKVP